MSWNDPERPGEAETPRIKVTDRRLFTSDGELRRDLPEEPEEPTPTTQPPSTAAGDRPQEAGFERRPLDEPEGVDFAMLVQSFYQQALFFLGEIPEPGTGRAVVNLDQARLSIDMLDLLRVKCRGNLSADEERLLEQVLYQLRMLYVAKSTKSV